MQYAQSKMASPTASPIEALPLLILERICEYLDDDLGNSPRRALWAFTLTSKRCCAAAVRQRFCQIPLDITEEKLDKCLTRWTGILSVDGRYRYVRRLKVSLAEHQRQKKELQDEEANEDKDAK